MMKKALCAVSVETPNMQMSQVVWEISPNNPIPPTDLYRELDDAGRAHVEKGEDMHVIFRIDGMQCLIDIALPVLKNLLKIKYLIGELFNRYVLQFFDYYKTMPTYIGFSETTETYDPAKLNRTEV